MSNCFSGKSSHNYVGVRSWHSTLQLISSETLGILASFGELSTRIHKIIFGVADNIIQKKVIQARETLQERCSPSS